MTDKVLTFDFQAKNHASSVFRELDGSLTGIGKAAAVAAGAVGLAAVAVGVESVKASVKFQSAMELIRTQAGASQAEVNRMSKAILALAPEVGTGPDALATGLYHVESAGIRGAKALDLLKIAAEGAKVGHADLESVTNALIASVNSGIKGVTSMSGAMGTLNGIVGAGNMRMQDLTDAFATGILSAAKTFGVSIQSVGGALADMTNQGIPAIDAATRITSAMRLMAAPTTKAAKELKSIGISQSELANDMRSSGGIQSAVDDLKTHLDRSGLSLSQQAALLATAFGGKQSLGILTLVGNVKELGTATDAVAKGANSFGAAWKATEQTAAEKWDSVTAALGSLAIEIGNILLPVAYNFITAMQRIVSGISDWVSANQPLIAQVGGALNAALTGLGTAIKWAGDNMGVVVPFIAGPLVVAFTAWAVSAGAAAAATALALAPFIAIGAAIGLIAAAIVNNWGGIRDQVQHVINGVLVPIFNNVLVPAFHTVMGVVGTLATDAGHLFNDVILPGARVVLGALGDAFNNVVKPAIETIIGVVGTLASAAGDFFDKVIAPALAGVLPGLRDFLNNVLAPAFTGVEGAVNLVWQAVQTLVGWGQQFIGWITSNKPLMDTLRTVADDIGTAFGIAADAVTTLLGYLGQLAQWVADHGGTIVSTLGQIVALATPLGGAQQIANNAQASAGHRASGGPVQQGAAYIVGENGPETFVPGQSGTIIPAGGMTAKSTDTASTLGLVGQVNADAGVIDALKQQAQAIKDHVFALRNHSFAMGQHTYELRQHVAALQAHAATMREHLSAMRDHLAALRLHKDKLAIHAQEMAIHAAELKLHAFQMTVHAAQLAVHSAQLAPHAVALQVHALQLKLHGIAMQQSDAVAKLHSDKMTAHAAEMVDHQAAMAAHSAALKAAAAAKKAAKAATGHLHTTGTGAIALVSGAVPVFVTNWAGGTAAGSSGSAAQAAAQAAAAATAGTTGTVGSYVMSAPVASYGQLVAMGQAPAQAPSHVEFHPGAFNVHVPQGTTAQQAQALLLELQRALTRNSYTGLSPR